MITQIGEWIELNFWQLAVSALSKTRPLSSRALRVAHGITTQHSFEMRQLAQAFARIDFGSPYTIAVSGWLLGLVLGLLFSSW